MHHLMNHIMWVSNMEWTLEPFRIQEARAVILLLVAIHIYDIMISLLFVTIIIPRLTDLF